jgi:hypothetical protein
MNKLCYKKDVIVSSFKNLTQLKNRFTIIIIIDIIMIKNIKRF